MFSGRRSSLELTPGSLLLVPLWANGKGIFSLEVCCPVSPSIFFRPLQLGLPEPIPTPCTAFLDVRVIVEVEEVVSIVVRH